MAARTTAEAKWGLRELDDGEIRFQDGASESRDTYVTGGRRERRRWTPQAADNLTDGPWGVSDPRVSALGRSRRAKGEGRSRPRFSALTGRRLDCGQQGTPPADVGHRHNVVNHQQFANARCGDNRDQRRRAESLSPSREGDHSSRELHPPYLGIFLRATCRARTKRCS
jgi:hypothetical protein